MQKVVIISADLSSLNTNAGVVQGSQWREILREESRLYLFGDGKFVTRAAFGFEPLRLGAPLRLDALRHLVEANQCKSILVDVFESTEHSAPNRLLLS